jgi:hypothetical protein
MEIHARQADMLFAVPCYDEILDEIKNERKKHSLSQKELDEYTQRLAEEIAEKIYPICLRTKGKNRMTDWTGKTI